MHPSLASSWVAALDKSRESELAEVRRIWKIYDERAGLVDARETLQLDAALEEGHVSNAWMAWSGAAEAALVDACRLAD